MCNCPFGLRLLSLFLYLCAVTHIFACVVFVVDFECVLASVRFLCQSSFLVLNAFVLCKFVYITV